MLDRSILASAIKDRRAWEKIRDYIRTSDASPPVGFWLERLREYYDRDKNASAADRDVLRELGSRAITNPKHAEAITAVLDDLPESASPDNVVALVLDMRRRNLILELAAESSPKKADKLFAELSEIWGKNDITTPSDVEYARDWEQLNDVVGVHRRIPFGIASLDSRTGGGVLPGHSVLIFGRTEIGKSCLTISLAANLVKAGQKLLYVGNEDSIHILKARMRTSLLGWTNSKIDQLPRRATRLLKELAADRLTMVSLAPGSISELEDLTEIHKPDVLVLDQIRNLSGTEDGMTQRMESNAIRLRALLNKRRMIGLSVTQAGDRSQRHGEDGPLYLSAGDVDSSRVGLPGTLDLMLGVGANREMLSRGLRMISFAKNKLCSDLNAREPLVLKFDLATSRVLDGE